MTLSADEKRCQFKLARLNRQLDELDPVTRQREVIRIRLQILWNSIRVAPGLTAPARAVLLEQIVDLGACCNVPIAGDVGVRQASAPTGQPPELAPPAEPARPTEPAA